MEGVSLSLAETVAWLYANLFSLLFFKCENLCFAVKKNIKKEILKTIPLKMRSFCSISPFLIEKSMEYIQKVREMFDESFFYYLFDI